MSVMPYATVVGVFRNRSAADLAIQALLNVGFKSEQMRCLIADEAGGFLHSLKSVFTGISPEEETLISNLTGMGLSSDEAQYFSDEYARGSAILAIKTQGDEEMALNILYQYGAQNARERARFGSVMPGSNRPVSSETANDYVVPVYPGALSPDSVPSQPQAVEAHATRAYQPDEAPASSNVDVSFHPTQPQPTSFGFNPQAYSIATTPRKNTSLSSEEKIGNLTEPLPKETTHDPNAPLPQEVPSASNAPFPQDTSNNTNTPFPQETGSDTTAPFSQEVVQTPGDQVHEAEAEEEYAVEEVVTPVFSDEQIDLINPEVIDVVEVDEVVESGTPVEQTTYPQKQTEMDNEPQNADQANKNDVYTPANELQQLLAQIEATRQQLEEARVQLEEAKGHESQLTTARLQFKELQAELQATQAELQETRQRITG